MKAINAIGGALLTAALTLAGCGGADAPSPAPTVAAVSYEATSGAVPPDLAWDETCTVSAAGTVFTRSGMSATTTVNTGTWTVAPFGANENTLFNALTGPHIFRVHKTGQGSVPALAIPPGGGTQIYTIQYDNNADHQVILGDGSLYNNAELVTAPIDAYIAALPLPPDAVNRFKTN